MRAAHVQPMTPPSPWPRLICLMLIVGIIAGLELEAMRAGLDGVALSVSIGSIGAIAGVIGGRLFPRPPKARA